jgi:hypothetical protein
MSMGIVIGSDQLWTISTTNVAKFCGLELNNIFIQQEFNFIEKDRTIIPERKTIPKDLSVK